MSTWVWFPVLKLICNLIILSVQLCPVCGLGRCPVLFQIGCFNIFISIFKELPLLLLWDELPHSSNGQHSDHHHAGHGVAVWKLWWLPWPAAQSSPKWCSGQHTAAVASATLGKVQGRLSPGGWSLSGMVHIGAWANRLSAEEIETTA